MAQQTVKLIRTEIGDLKIDYTALANLPTSDTTLKKSGGFADAKVVGTEIANLKNSISGTGSNFVLKTTTINKKPLSGNITLSASDVGAASAEHTHSISSTSGTLPEDRGGTGATNGSDGLKNLLAAGAMVLSSNQYGTQTEFDKLKSKSAVAGQIFFVKV